MTPNFREIAEKIIEERWNCRNQVTLRYTTSQSRDWPHGNLFRLTNVN